MSQFLPFFPFFLFFSPISSSSSDESESTITLFFYFSFFSAFYLYCLSSVMLAAFLIVAKFVVDFVFHHMLQIDRRAPLHGVVLILEDKSRIPLECQNILGDYSYFINVLKYLY